MDWYLAVDAIAVLSGGAVYWKLRSRESLLLLGFFATSAVFSLGLSMISQSYGSNLYHFGVIAFFACIMIFAALSKSPRILLGYIAYFMVLTMDTISELTAYPFLILAIFSYQLWIVHNEN